MGDRVMTYGDWYYASFDKQVLTAYQRRTIWVVRKENAAKYPY
jgi:hypothetical protein